MCIVCLLRKAQWDYWQLLGSEALYKEANKEKFYSVLTQYLDDYGPHFRNELLDRFKFFLPKERRSQLLTETRFNDFFLRNLLNTKELRNNKIRTSSIQDLVIKYIPKQYDYFMFEKPSHVTIPQYLDRLLYTSEESLKEFMNASDLKIEKRLTISIQPLELREPSHSKY